MKGFIFILLVFFSAAMTVNAQKAAGKQVFRANKDQTIMAQKMLKVEPTGKIDTATRNALKKFQEEKELKVTGTLDRATMQKLGIGLTTAQREISESPAEPTAPANDPPIVADAFVATKEQITQAQKLLKDEGFYSGTITGSVNPATREALKKYQKANDLEDTGTVNQITLEKMDIQLTAKQKGN
jgi:peptidoglycan hydrolase-like protein with peptidoglycan-binding domain